MPSFFLEFTELLKDHLSEYTSQSDVVQSTKKSKYSAFFCNTVASVTRIMTDSETLTPAKNKIGKSLHTFITLLKNSDTNDGTIYDDLIGEIIKAKYDNMMATVKYKSGYTEETRAWLIKELENSVRDNEFDLFTRFSTINEGTLGNNLNTIAQGTRLILRICRQYGLIDKQYDPTNPEHVFLYHLAKYQIHSQMSLAKSQSAEVSVKKQIAVETAVERFRQDLSLPKIANEENVAKRKAEIIINLFHILKDLANSNLLETTNKPALNLPLVNISTVNIMSVPINFNYGEGELGVAIKDMHADLNAIRKTITKAQIQAPVQVVAVNDEVHDDDEEDDDEDDSRNSLKKSI